MSKSPQVKIPTELPESLDPYTCMSFGIRMFCWLLLMCCLFYFIGLLLVPVDVYQQTQYMQRCRCGCQRGRGCGRSCPFQDDSIENFSNDTMYAFSPEPSSRFQRIPLVAPNNEDGNPKNLYFGQAERYIIPKGNKINYKLQIFADLPVLDGNIYANHKADYKQQYTAVLHDDNYNDNIELEIKKDNDGLYKLKYDNFDITQIEKLVQMKYLDIYYTYDADKAIILSGQFR